MVMKGQINGLPIEAVQFNGTEENYEEIRNWFYNGWNQGNCIERDFFCGPLLKIRLGYKAFYDVFTTEHTVCSTDWIIKTEENRIEIISNDDFQKMCQPLDEGLKW